MNQKQKPKGDMSGRFENWARDEARIRKVLAHSGKSLNMAQVYWFFWKRFDYLPDIERRMRVLVKQNYVVKNTRGKVALFSLSKEK